VHAKENSDGGASHLFSSRPAQDGAFPCATNVRIIARRG
jgi:hypothetical protein